MIEDALNIAIQAFTACSEWFTEILDAVEGGPFYLAMVFIVLSVGFLLSRFQVSMYIGSDFVDKAASAYKSRAGRSDRSGRRSPKPSGYIGPGNDMRWR